MYNVFGSKYVFLVNPYVRTA